MNNQYYLSLKSDEIEDEDSISGALAHAYYLFDLKELDFVACYYAYYYLGSNHQANAEQLQLAAFWEQLISDCQHYCIGSIILSITCFADEEDHEFLDCPF